MFCPRRACFFFWFILTAAGDIVGDDVDALHAGDLDRDALHLALQVSHGQRGEASLGLGRVLLGLRLLQQLRRLDHVHQILSATT